jgi:hypothetical protein
MDIVATLALFAITLGGLVWVARQVRTRGVGGSFLSPVQDIWDPAAYRSDLEMETIIERQAPNPANDDLPWLHREK